MSLRDAAVKMVEGESANAYLDRALVDARAIAGTDYPQLRIERSTNLFGDKDIRCGAGLWVERGTGRSESWQRLTVTIFGSSFEEVCSLIARALDRDVSK